MVSPSGFFVLRTPLLPVDELAAWSQGLRAPVASEAELAAALEADRRELRSRLAAIVARNDVREALFVASPSLEESIPRWLAEPDGEHGQKVERALVRYLLRMAGRPTPYGLFAGHALGWLGDATRLVVGPNGAYQRYTRLDMDYVLALADKLARDPVLARGLSYRPNSSLHSALDGRLHYAEARVDAVRGRSYRLVAAGSTPYLLATLKRARAGASLEALADALVADDPEVSADQAHAFLRELVSSQVLVPELAPAATGREPIEALIGELSRGAESGAVVRRLEETRASLAALDQGGVGHAPERYRDIARGLEELGVPVEISRLFQVELRKPAPRAMLGQAVVKEMVRGVELLHQLSASLSEPLRAFREAFERRYETREVPLVEALDEASGIGLGQGPGQDIAPLLEGLGLAAQPAPATRSLTPRWSHLMRRVLGAAADGAFELVLDDDDVKALAGPAPPLPDALQVIATVCAASGEACARGEFELLLTGATGPSGATMLARFCHGDAELAHAVAAHHRAEEALRPEAVFAEIVHLPPGRIGNVVHRPHLREHELVILGRSGAPLEKQLPITDILVSIVDGRVRLRSASLGREIIPRLTNAHNYFAPSNIDTYRFLATLARDGLAANLAWSWGEFDGAPFLPRVRHGRVILALARWTVVDGLAELVAGSAEERFRRVRTWRAQHGLPRFVMLADLDNMLPVDFDNILSVDAFVHLVKRRPFIQLVERHPPPEQLCVRGPEGAFVHEIIVPFVRQATALPAPLRKPEAPAAPEARRFPPGSDWLYARIYTSAASADQVLKTALAPLVARVVPALAARWFFIRYADPDWHLRVRFQGEPARLQAELLPALESALAPLMALGVVHRLELGTYEREIERYGGPEGIVLAERLFHADSHAALLLVGALAGDAGAEARWRITLRAMHDLLEGLGLDLAARRTLVGKARDGLAVGFLGPSARALGDRFRRLRPELELLLTGPPPGPLAALVDTARSVGAALRERGLPVAELAGSYLHMHVNRMLRSSSRAQELVLHDFLGRLYESRLARERRGGNR
ncbi:MAG: lantibiotic dehydratase [Deltaproteobacteria bacterium]|nr:lantibiotic dehydratase [Deltaproteobacteria bacterium]